MISRIASVIGALVIYFAVLAVIQAQERAAEREMWCRPPKAGERLIAWGSADGKPFCTYHTKFSYGDVPQ